MILGFIRYQFSSYVRSLKFIPPLTLFGAWLIIFYTYSGVPIMSSYAVTCISVYLVMTWVSMNIFSLEEDGEKNLLFVQLKSKRSYLFGKWIVCFIIAFILGCIAIVYPLLMNSFKDEANPIHLGMAIYGTLFSALFGILLGSFYTNTKVDSKRFAWLSAIFVIVVSIAKEGIIEKMPIFNIILIPIPPIAQIIVHFTDEAYVTLSKSFWLDALWVGMYTTIGFYFITRMFYRKER